MEEDRTESMTEVVTEEEVNTAAGTPETEAPEEKAATERAAGGEGADALREKLNRAQERVTQLERERALLGQGVPEEDLDYYVFKIGKLVTPEKDFGTAAKEYLKEHGAQLRGPAQRSTGASLSGRTPRTHSTNDTMNRLLRGQ